jgi:hypothetical protein
MAGAWPVPDTGQLKCYDNNSEIFCPEPGENFYGQDGSYLINPPSFTKLDSEGNNLADSAASWVMVRDNVTGLIWEVKQNKDEVQDYGNLHDADNSYTWYDNNPETNGGDAGTQDQYGRDTEGFINALNEANYGGFNDWRLPTRKELDSIINYVRYNPNIDTTYFPDTQSSEYWSSTTYANDTSIGWYVHFGSGSVNLGPKSYSYYVRAVRAGQNRLLDNLVINGDGTVTDPRSGLMWQMETAPGTYEWQQALSYVQGLNAERYLGYSDWRLPNIRELNSIVDFDTLWPRYQCGLFP